MKNTLSPFAVHAVELAEHFVELQNLGAQIENTDEPIPELSAEAIGEARPNEGIGRRRTAGREVRDLARSPQASRAVAQS